MSAKVLQMVTAKSAAEGFHRTVETVEASVKSDIQSVTDENGTCHLCVLDLPNPGPHGGLCRAVLTHENVDQLIEALVAWKAQA